MDESRIRMNAKLAEAAKVRAAARTVVCQKAKQAQLHAARAAAALTRCEKYAQVMKTTRVNLSNPPPCGGAESRMAGAANRAIEEAELAQQAWSEAADAAHRMARIGVRGIGVRGIGVRVSRCVQKAEEAFAQAHQDADVAAAVAAENAPGWCY